MIENRSMHILPMVRIIIRADDRTIYSKRFFFVRAFGRIKIHAEQLRDTVLRKHHYMIDKYFHEWGGDGDFSEIPIDIYLGVRNRSFVLVDESFQKQRLVIHTQDLRTYF